MTKRYHDLSGGLLGDFTPDALGYDPNSPVPPSEFPTIDPRRIAVDYRCPSCGYGWCGSPSPVKIEVDENE